MRLSKANKLRLKVSIIAIVVFVLVFKLIYNKMIDEEHFLHIAKGEVQVAMMKRAELNKNVAESVRQYVEMEGELMHKLIELARAIKSGADARRILAMQTDIERLIASLDLLVMMSPQLRSKGPYLYLMETLKDTENELLSAIKKYNERASEFNMFIYKVPYNIVAKLYDFKKAEPFEARIDNYKAPDVLELAMQLNK